MTNEQRIKELREMFLQLSEIILQEMKEGKEVRSTDTFNVMKKILAELEYLEVEALGGSRES